MNKVTEDGFEKVRKYLAIMAAAKGNFYENTAAIQQAYDEAKPTAIFLIQYYFTVIDPDNGDISQPFTTRPYGTTETQRAIIAFSNGYPYQGYYGQSLLNFFKPTLLEDSIVHYKKRVKDRLNDALLLPLSQMRGEQFLALLQEYERRKAEGFPLMMESTQGDVLTTTYQNPYLAAVSEMVLNNIDGRKSDPDHEANPTGDAAAPQMNTPT